MMNRELHQLFDLERQNAEIKLSFLNPDQMVFLYVQSKTSLQDISEQDLREIITQNEEMYGTCEQQINELVKGLKAIQAITFDPKARVFSSVNAANAVVHFENLKDVTIVVCPGVYDSCDLDTPTPIYGTETLIMISGVVCRRLAQFCQVTNVA
jgi:hypothetical protein